MATQTGFRLLVNLDSCESRARLMVARAEDQTASVGGQRGKRPTWFQTLGPAAYRRGGRNGPSLSVFRLGAGQIGQSGRESVVRHPDLASP